MISGGVVATNVMVCEQVALFLQSSVAVQLRLKMRTAGQSAGSSESKNVIVRFVSQVSLAVGLPNTGTAPATHSRVRSGSQRMTGGVVSTKVMHCVQLAEWREASVV